MGRIKGKRGIELPLLIVSQHLVWNARYSVLYRARWKRKRIQLPAESPLILLAGQSLFSTRLPSRVGIMESHGNVLRDSNDLFAWARAAINPKGNHTRAPRVHAYETCSRCLRIYIFFIRLKQVTLAVSIQHCCQDHDLPANWTIDNCSGGGISRRSLDGCAGDRSNRIPFSVHLATADSRPRRVFLTTGTWILSA